MLIPELLSDKAFLKKLSHVRSTSLDEVLDELIQSTDDTFISQCDQQPDPQTLKALNIARQSIKGSLSSLKTTNLNITED